MERTQWKMEGFTVSDVPEPDEVEGSRKSRFYERWVQPCLVELLGTSLFVFVGCSSGVVALSQGPVVPAVAHGLALGVLITVFGEISGGHFNPAVSLSVYLCGGMRLRLLLPYIVVQLLGGMMGAGLTKALYPPFIYDNSLGGSFYPNSNELVRVTLAEALMTMMLTMVVCMGGVNAKTKTPLAGFCIGLTVTANILAGNVISGACMNPARALGPAVVANQWYYHWVYWVGPLGGALLNVIFIRLFFGDKKTRILLK